jgi:hypothetical protein
MLPVESDLSLQDDLKSIVRVDSFPINISFEKSPSSESFSNLHSKNTQPFAAATPPQGIPNYLVDDGLQDEDTFIPAILSQLQDDEPQTFQNNSFNPTSTVVPMETSMRSNSIDTSSHSHGSSHPLRIYDPLTIKDKPCPEFLFQIFADQVTNQIQNRAPLADNFQNAHALMKNILQEKDVRESVSDFFLQCF